jgi:hypothetical protein
MDLFNLIEKTYAATTNEVNLLVPDVVNGGVDPSQGLEGYISKIFPLIIELGVAVAIFSLTYWGLRTIISEVPGFKIEGQERMQAALLGLGLLLIAWLVLNTINPEIFKASLDKIGGQ